MNEQLTIQSIAFKNFLAAGYDEFRTRTNLDSNSTIVIIGGYLGNFSDMLLNHVSCNFYIYEPVKSFYQKLVEKYKHNPKIKIFNYGLEKQTTGLEIFLSGEGSSLYRGNGQVELIELRDVAEELAPLGKIDLLEINCEGSEYSIIPRLCESGVINNCREIQIQYHLINNAIEQHNQCTDLLKQTHNVRWNFPWIWECWRIKNYEV